MNEFFPFLIGTLYISESKGSGNSFGFEKNDSPCAFGLHPIVFQVFVFDIGIYRGVPPNEI